MANAKRTYATDWVVAPEEAALQTDRMYLLHEYYTKKAPPRTDFPSVEQLSGDVSTSSQAAPLMAQADLHRSEVLAFPTYQQLVFAPSEAMWATQEWDGHVTEIGEERLFAMITPVGSASQETERLEYPLSSLSDWDRKNLVVGSIFRLSAGYSRKATGQVRHQLSLYFRPRGKKVTKSSHDVEARFKKLFKAAVQAPPSQLFTGV